MSGLVGTLVLELAGDPIARAEPNIVRFGQRYGMADSDATKKGKRDWFSTWQNAGSPRLIDGPIQCELLIVVDRPKSHFGTGRNADLLKPTAPRFPETKPDISNVLKLVEDALKSRAFRDDSQIVGLTATKRYAVDGERPYTRVELGVLVPLDALFPPLQEASA